MIVIMFVDSIGMQSSQMVPGHRSLLPTRPCNPCRSSMLSNRQHATSIEYLKWGCGATNTCLHANTRSRCLQQLRPNSKVRTRATDPKTAKQSIPLDTDATATSESSRPVAEPRSQATASKAGDTGSTAVPPNTLPAAEDAPRTLETTSQARASTSGSGMRDYLYEPAFGLPVVRRKVEYGELLKEIRQNKVREIAYFDSNPAPPEKAAPSNQTNLELEGYCLVVYNDDTVAQAFLPPIDVRASYAMETHGVMQTRLLGAPGPGGLLNPPSGRLGFLQGNFFKALPILLLLGVYGAVQFAQFLKGDLVDRQKIRQYEIRKEKEARQQAEADEMAGRAVNLAAEGNDVDTICQLLDEDKIPYSKDYIERLVEDARARAEAGEPLEDSEAASEMSKEASAREKEMIARIQKEQEDNMSEMDKAKELLKMKTVKIQRAAPSEDPAMYAMRQRLRKAQSRMKGVKLQYTEEQRPIMFDDVAGIGEAKVDLTELVDFFVKPGKFKRSGARIPKGVLLCGPPGTGKTLLARAVAGEARVAFLSLNASEFVEMFAGLGASRVRDLFSQARELAPAIVFIDEVDAVGRQRGGRKKGNDEREQTLNQLLIEMDGFGPDSGVIVMAATNRLDVLDTALVRPGRFDRIIEVGVPEYEGRIEILKVHLGYRAHADDIDLTQLAFETHSYTGAQLASLVNDAAIVAARRHREEICMEDFKEALKREMVGNPRRGAYSAERQRRLAVQDGSTALICALLPAIEPLVSVTIVPRERWPLGQTVVRVNEQRERTNLFTREYLEQQLRTVLAGRAAEEIMYGEDDMTTINQRKLALARSIAVKLVVSGAMNDVSQFSPRSLSVPFDSGANHLKQIIPHELGEDTLQDADQALQNLLDRAYGDAKAMLLRNRAALDEIIHRLCTEEPGHVPEVGQTFQGNTLLGSEVQEIVQRLAHPSDLEHRERNLAAFV